MPRMPKRDDINYTQEEPPAGFIYEDITEFYIKIMKKVIQFSSDSSRRDLMSNTRLQLKDIFDREPVLAQRILGLLDQTDTQVLIIDTRCCLNIK